jgi:hypothetical protein
MRRINRKRAVKSSFRGCVFFISVFGVSTGFIDHRLKPVQKLLAKHSGENRLTNEREQFVFGEI